ncbi:hypothetical protein [Solidesulfovibrio sp.]
MPHSDRLRKITAFTAAGLVVVWTVGSFLTAMFKLGYRLALGAWPDTLVYGLVPEAWTPGVAALNRGGIAVAAWQYLLLADVLTWLLLVPPLLLAPCLLILRADHGGVLPALRSTTKPFSPGPPEQTRPMPFPRRGGQIAVSTRNGTTT